MVFVTLISDGAIAEEWLVVRGVRFPSIRALALDHPGDHLLLLELVLLDVLLRPQEPTDGHNCVKVNECGRVVEADPTQGPKMSGQYGLQMENIFEENIIFATSNMTRGRH